MKHQIIGALTLLSGLGLIIITVVRKFGVPNGTPKMDAPSTASFQLPDIDILSRLPELPNWSTGTFVLIGIGIIMWLLNTALLIYGAAKRKRFFLMGEENRFFTVMKGTLPYRYISGVKGKFVVQDGPNVGNVRDIPDPKKDPSSMSPEERSKWQQDVKDYHIYLKGAEVRGPFRLLARIKHGIENVVLIPLFNIWWIGIYPFFQLHTYPFRYNKYEKGSDKSAKAGEPAAKAVDYRLESRDGTADSVFFINTVGVRFSDLETAGDANQVVPVVVELLVVFEAKNIHKMQFRSGSTSWLERATAAIEDQVRLQVAQHTYFDLLQDKKIEAATTTDPSATGGSKCKRCIEDLVEQVRDKVNNGHGPSNPSIIEELGVEVREIRFLNVDLSGEKASAERRRLDAALMAKMVAEEEGKGKIAAAEAEAKATLAKGKAENEVLKEKLRIHQEHAGAAPALFAQAVGTMTGTLALGDKAAERLIIQATHGGRPAPAPTPAPTATTANQ